MRRTLPVPMRAPVPSCRRIGSMVRLKPDATISFPIWVLSISFPVWVVSGFSRTFSGSTKTSAGSSLGNTAPIASPSGSTAGMSLLL